MMTRRLRIGGTDRISATYERMPADARTGVPMLRSRPSRRLPILALRSVLGTSMSSIGMSAYAQEIEVQEELEVIGVTPTHGVGIDRGKIPANVQSATHEDLRKAQTLDLSDYLNRNLGSVNINAAQTNVLQSDVNYRGFTASPLLGLPQGLAVYVNGIRVNEVFGDTINWDLLPESMIDSINLIGGANPIFGLNTLGGALSIQTKNGFTNEGLSGEVYGGSFGRVVTSVEAGGNNGTLGYFLNLHYLTEDGWRDRQDSDAFNLYGSLEWRSASSTVDVQYMHANTDLTGNGALPVEQLSVDRSSFFTAPDVTKNLLHLVNLQGTHWFNRDIQVSGNAFYRDNRTTSFNGDGTPFEECQFSTGEFLVDEDAAFACDGTEVLAALAGEELENVITDQRGNFINGNLDAINNRSERDQRSFGGNVQATFLQSLFGHGNRLIVGAAFNRGDVEFRSSVEAVELGNERVTTKTGIFVSGQATALDAATETWSVYFTESFDVIPAITLTVAGRYNDTRIQTSNAGELLDENGDGIDDLTGDHRYRRLNPAVGMTWQAMDALNLYGGYSESSRAPTPVELACADENAPCLLPNAFLADPPLEQVVAKSFEGGVRGRVPLGIDWNLGGFYTVNVDDIIFLSTGGTTGNQGFFDNVGNTRRAGLEVGLKGTWRALSWFANYGFVRATFGDGFIASSPNHPLAEDLNGDGDVAEIRVAADDRIPGIAEHTFKLGADYAVLQQLSVGLDVTVNSGVYLRGDEANLLDRTDAFAVVNLRGRYTIGSYVSIFARLENVFDTDYETFGLLGETNEVFPEFNDNRFLGPGAPIGGWLGVELHI